MPYQIPPWVGQPADPAAHYQAGFQLGTHLGAQQAAQIFQQQQLARELQKDEFEAQKQNLAMQFQVEEAANQHRATAQYQNLISSGVDPADALKAIGPAMGMDPTRIIAMQDQRQRQAFVQNQINDRLSRQLEVRQSLAQQAAAKPTSMEKEREDRVKLETEVNDLNQQLQSSPEDSRIKTRLARATSALETWDKQHPGGQQTEITTDAQGNVKLVMGTGKIQPGAASLVQKDLADLKNSVVQIDQIRNKLREKDVGIAGYAWDELANKWVGQMVPEAADPSVSGNRVQLQKAVDAYLQTQTAKGRLSASERADIRDALVTRKVGESLVRAKPVLDSMARVQKFDAITKAKSIKQALEPWMFQNLTRTEIRQLMKEGVLTQDEAFNWAKQATEW